MPRQLVIEAFTMALKNSHPRYGLSYHSDQGVQYACKVFQARLNTAWIQSSMSCKSNCWDYAVAESFFHSLKLELIHGRNYRTHQKAWREIFDYIEVFHSRQRRHSAFGYLTPAEYEKLAIAA